MDQGKIGNFIRERRKEQGMTQEELAEKLNISKNAVSKWERGMNLPDVSIMQELCGLLNITLNELFAGEKIADEKYKAVADGNLLLALENSSFTLKEKIAFYKRKWRKEHVFQIILSALCWLALIFILKFQNVEIYVIACTAGFAGILLYAVLYNQMMIYVEARAYKKIEK